MPPTCDDVLAAMPLSLQEVPQLPATVRRSVITFLIRWECYAAALACLEQLVPSRPDLLSLQDDLATVYLGLDQPLLAVAAIRSRNAVRASSSSRSLEARALFSVGDHSAAWQISDQLLALHGELLLSWDLEVDLCLACGDLEGADAALRQRETFGPGSSATAYGLARLWQARRDSDKALLWARTAVSRAESDRRAPSIGMLRLLEELYSAAGDLAQMQDTPARIERRRQRELDGLRAALRLARALPSAPEPATSPPAPWPQTPTPPLAPAMLVGELTPTEAERARLEAALRSHFTHTALRPGQEETIVSVLRGDSVLAVMPTGGGKSPCYQLAALLLPHTTLVISPLIALMKDQIDGLPPGVATQATALNSTLDGAELSRRMQRAAAGDYRLVYVAPERLRQRPFLHALKKAGVSLLVVDEAHCVSLWGHDFRPDYLFIAKAWEELGKPPILAMTATATPRVQDDIQSALGRTHLVLIDVDRPNLHLKAHHFANDAEKQPALVASCRQIEGNGIVYANSRQRCEDLADLLRTNGCAAIHYHARMEDRGSAQERFMSGDARIVVATIAFGMGIDKPDVRFIVHYNPPRTLENYYQEAGRAGRDGGPAQCILFHTLSDWGHLKACARQEALTADFLRDVYSAVRRRVGHRREGLVAIADLERDTGQEETQLRVAIQFLEAAGLLSRGFDLPRSATLEQTCSQPFGPPDADLARLVQVAGLRPRRPVDASLWHLIDRAGLDPQMAEAQLLAWHDRGQLKYRGVGRDMLLALPEPPADSQQRVAALLADYRSGQDARLAEMMAYADTRFCRHGHISTHFSGRPIERCQACDNCAVPDEAGTTLVVPRASPDAASVADRHTILRAIQELPFPLGKTGLARALTGRPTAPVGADRFPLFGSLRTRTIRSVASQVAELERTGFLRYVDNGECRVLDLTHKALESIQSQQRREAHRADAPRAVEMRSDQDHPETAARLRGAARHGEPPEYDTGLFEQLRVWRRQAADALGVPAYVVLHDSVLKEIAARLPRSEPELAAIKGVGPRKMESYSRAILDLVARYRHSASQTSEGNHHQTIRG